MMKRAIQFAIGLLIPVFAFVTLVDHTANPEALRHAAEKTHTPVYYEPVTIGLSVVGAILIVGFCSGLLAIPVGYENGKVKFKTWCGTGRHFHTVYWVDKGFQTVHPRESEGE